LPHVQTNYQSAYLFAHITPLPSTFRDSPTYFVKDRLVT